MRRLLLSELYLRPLKKNKEIEALSIFEVVCKVNAMIVKQLNLSMKDLFLGRLEG